ncbi:MAG: transposase [Candidatus Poribacteria bacterium]|nr:transposase [Candidatus Poribacteria bacterium]
MMMKHETMNGSQKWEPGGVHTNTMEGFWSFVKRAWYGSHHHYSTAYTPLYLAETCYKDNYRVYLGKHPSKTHTDFFSSSRSYRFLFGPITFIE